MLAEAAAQAQARQFDAGVATLEGMIGLIQSRKRASNPSARWTERLAAVTPALKAALQGESPAGQASELKLKFSEAQTFAQKGDFEQALRLLAEVEKRLGTTAGSGTPKGDRPPTADGQAAFAARAKGLKGRLDELTAADPTAAAPLRTQFATALGHAQAKRYDQGQALLAQIEASLAPPLKAAPTEAPATTTVAPKVLFIQSLLVWDAARKRDTPSCRHLSGRSSDSSLGMAASA